MEALIEQLNEHLNLIDWCWIALVVIWSVLGFIKGLSKQVAGLIIYGGTALGGWRLYEPLSEVVSRFTPQLENGPAVQIITLILVVVGILVVLKLLFLALKNMLEFAFPSGVERFGGLLAGTTKALIVIGLAILLVGISKHEYLSEHVLEQSMFGRIGHQHIPAWYDTYIGGGAGGAIDTDRDK
ncbi:MAG: putative membrane protein required for colicin V production [Kiritimatiellia bacterium]|jgi:uncharacterized membrane protein required for colicin V production